MKTLFSGKVLVLPDNIDTDQIYPGRYLDIVEPAAIGRHCLEGVSADIAENFQKGGIVVAGRNFGCGSSREHAPIALLNMGASVILADSFARIFYRNAINLGLPLLVCTGLSARLETGDEITADVQNGTVRIAKTGETLACDEINAHIKTILEAGGIKKLFLQRSERMMNQ